VARGVVHDPNHPRRQAVVRAISDAWTEGCPVTGYTQDAFEQKADVAIRRWDSIERRRPKKVLTIEDRIEDLAKGLRNHFSPDPKMVGPLMKDYR
jgi:hypothetical protein